MFDSCTRCGVPLEDVADILHRRRTDFPQKKDALVLEIHGGYGMYLDESDTAAILCKECAEQFFIVNHYLMSWLDRNAGNIYYG
jgi:hypothetical protein